MHKYDTAELKALLLFITIYAGIDIRKIKRGALRSIFGVVLQDTWLSNGSIRDNIAYGRQNAREDEIPWAAKAAHADHFIRTLPEGYRFVDASPLHIFIKKIAG